MTKIKPVGYKLSPTEYEIHVSFVDYVNKRYPDFAVDLIHIPNEGKRTIAGGVRQKRLGLKAGVPDLFFARPAKNPLGVTLYSGLWIEFKTEKGRVSKEQEVFILRASQHGYLAIVCRNIEHAINIFDYYVGYLDKKG